MKKFVNLYNTSEYSFLDSLIRVEELVKIAKENNLPAVALTDHNNMFGLGLFLSLCQKYEIKPIIGIDLDVEQYRFILLAKNYVGFQKINKLILLKSQNVEVKINELDDEDFFVLDHPNLGYYAQTEDNKYSSMKNYYISSLDSSISNAIFLKENKLLNSTDLPILQTIQELGNNQKTKMVNDYLADVKVSEKIIDRLYWIIEQCNVIFPKKELHLASFTKSKENNKKLFMDLIAKGVEKRKSELEPYKDIWQSRLNHEFKIIKDLDFINYFLIIQDLINWAKNNDIAIGPGRGSAAGSLISYLLNITDINPLKYDLLFERFLNPERVSWPDIDIDIQDDQRFRVFEYLQNKYGFANTSLISTFQTIGPKSAIRDIGRIKKIDIGVINYLSKMLDWEDSLDSAYKNNVAFRTEINKYGDLFEMAKKVEGLPRQQGFHAAGLVICDKEIYNYAPVSISNEGNFQQVQIPMNYLENFGLLKIDLLGLKTLSEIKLIEDQLPKEYHFDYLVKKNPNELQDYMTLNMLNNGFTEGIFQLESPGMKKTIKKVNLKSFEDLFAVISLFRPGPIAYIDEYAKVNKNVNLLPKIDVKYDKIVKSTNGIIVYQEQIMQIAQTIANMSFAQADLLRKAISKKNEADLKKYGDIFYENAIKTGLEEKIIKKIYDNILHFGQYGFNKSHAVCYAYLTMKMSYYKARYPLIFYNSLITNSAGAQATINKYVEEMKLGGLKVYSPNILYSSKTSKVINQATYLPFEMIKGFGNERVNKIINEVKINGPFEEDQLLKNLFRLRLAGLKDAALELLIKANTFRDFGHMKYILEAEKKVKEIYKMLDCDNKQFADVQKKFDSLINQININSPEKDFDFEAKNELATLGAYYNAFPTSKYEDKYTQKLININKDSFIICAAELTVKKLIKSKKQEILEFRDSSSTTTFFINEDEIDRFSPLKEGDVVELEIIWSKNKKLLKAWKELK